MVVSVGSLQETWVLPTHKYVGENAKNVGKGYPDVQNDVGKNVGGNASREAFPTPNWFPDAVGCVGKAGVGKTLFPTPFMPTHLTASGKPIFRRFFPDMSTNCLHLPFCGPSAWVPNQGLLSSLVVDPTPDRISHPQRVADYPLG
ncbi:hypothetical protein E6C27_scaffold238G00760 [Cucumis melo var. makuwa]|uniref:Uncharacterized protein n=1 Tax=Cucumis melo var. makuwa TaxID=1194695 RepID=A0A5A7VNF8_CUCMM|nr:hypothetical protein E6C27_scaffold238G00760 [Cucumis melo var. makuwa]